MRTFKRCLAYLAIISLFIVSFVGSASAYSSSGPSRPHREGFSIASATNGQNVVWFDNASITGLRMYMSTGRNVDIHSSASPWENRLFHTMRPPNSACIEVVIEHWRGADNVMRNKMEVLPWCNGQTVATYSVAMDATWAGKYARTSAWSNWDWPSEGTTYNDETVYVTVQKWNAASNCWSAYLYNYNTGLWEAIGSPNYVCGTPNDPIPGEGWTSFEEQFKSNIVCGSLGTYSNLQSRNLQNQLSVGGTYSVVAAGTLSYTDGGATACEGTAWGSHHVTSSPYGYVLCAAGVQPNCD